MANYEQLGVKPIINAAGTFTKFSGSLMDEEVLDAMKEASKQFVDVNELLEATGDYLANLLEVDSALVTSGAAAGMAQTTAACMAGSDPHAIRSLPDTEGLNDEVVVMRSHRNPYDQAMSGVGANFVEVGNAIETFQWELDAAISEDTAAVAYFVQSSMLEASLTLEEVLEVAHSNEIPVICDAAAEIPPANNLSKFAHQGADIVLFSGGKELRGPQSSGLVIGRSDIIETARLHGPPKHNIGRPMKIDKETVMGLVRAVELYLEEDHQARMDQWKDQVSKVVNGLEDLDGVSVKSGYPAQPFCQPATIPRVYLKFDENVTDLNREQVKELLMEGEPPIATETYNDSLVINPHMLQKGEEETVIRRLKEIVIK
ncbi:aminotransferase class V-fold PLP-dependent enzyme [Candidatus Bipolaricaulota bacterium]|nr:aminotransferase class V-fold PLP-dependent enzyme [Candidatus Bipolaricaulota bacterium]